MLWHRKFADGLILVTKLLGQCKTVVTKAMEKRKKSVLLVDDDPDLLELMQGILRSEGYDTSICWNAENIEERIGENPPDIILLDVMMDNVNGSDICKIIKKNPSTRHIKIILFSANDNLQLIALDCGADASLSKPYDRKLARETFARVLTP